MWRDAAPPGKASSNLNVIFLSNRHLRTTYTAMSTVARTDKNPGLCAKLGQKIHLWLLKHNCTLHPMETRVLNNAVFLLTYDTSRPRFAWDQTSESWQFLLAQRHSDRHPSFPGLLLLRPCWQFRGTLYISVGFTHTTELYTTKHFEQLLFVSYGPDSCCPAVTVPSQYLDQPFFSLPFQKRLACLYLFHISLICQASHIMQTSERATNSEAAAKVYPPPAKSQPTCSNKMSPEVFSGEKKKKTPQIFAHVGHREQIKQNLENWTRPLSLHAVVYHLTFVTSSDYISLSWFNMHELLWKS